MADFTAIQAALTSHAASLGQFDRVTGHEPKNAPGKGLTAAFWIDYIGPFAIGSGLAATTGLVTFWCRISTAMTQEAQDEIDPLVLTATSLLLNEYSGDFELGGLIRDVDLLGMSGTALSARAGYLTQDDKAFRVMTITIPLIVNDLWTQAP